MYKSMVFVSCSCARGEMLCSQRGRRGEGTDSGAYLACDCLDVVVVPFYKKKKTRLVSKKVNAKTAKTN